MEVSEEGGKTEKLLYDRLLVATGARAAAPSIDGSDLEGVYTLHTMEDSFRIQEHLNRGVRSVVLAGSGYIGLEMADALTHRGKDVILAGRSEAVLPTVDRDFGEVVEGELERHGVSVHSGTNIVAIERSGRQLRVYGGQGVLAEADMVIVGAAFRRTSNWRPRLVWNLDSGEQFG